MSEWSQPGFGVPSRASPNLTFCHQPALSCCEHETTSQSFSLFYQPLVLTDVREIRCERSLSCFPPPSPGFPPFRSRSPLAERPPSRPRHSLCVDPSSRLPSIKLTKDRLEDTDVFVRLLQSRKLLHSVDLLEDSETRISIRAQRRFGSSPEPQTPPVNTPTSIFTAHITS